MQTKHDDHIGIAQAFVPRMIDSGEEGLVVNTSSFGGRIYMHGPAYGAGKAAVDKMAHDMAVDFRAFGVAAVSIWMGLLMTDVIVGLVMALLPGGIDVIAAVYGAALGFLGFWALGAGMTWFLRRFAPDRLERAGVDQALGGGDVKMMGMVGAFLGPAGVPLTVFLGTVLGLVIFVPISMRTGKLIPFGIFLAAGAAVTYGWGDWILDWYLGSVVGLPR